MSMNPKFRSAIRSFRLRTLPLSLAGVILGALLAASEFKVSAIVIVFLLLTTIFLQILSNLSNELGDVLNGTDTPDRKGPEYGIAEGGLSIKLGLKGSRIYQTILVAAGWILLAVFTALYKPSPWHWLFLLALPLHLIHLKGIWTRTERALDPMLPLLVMSTFILSLILGISFVAA